MSSILVVDDQMANLDLMEYILRRSGHDVVTAVGGRAGLEKAEEVRPDLVLIDLRMPGIDGWELARRIRRHDALSGIRLLAVSVGPADTAEAREAGFDGFFHMPFEPADLIHTVDSVLAEPELERPQR